MNTSYSLCGQLLSETDGLEAINAYHDNDFSGGLYIDAITLNGIPFWYSTKSFNTYISLVRRLIVQFVSTK